MKGQYYILAAAFTIFMVASIYYVSKTPFNVKNTASDYIFDNIKNDFPNAINTIAENDSTTSVVETNMNTYISFLQDYTSQRNLALRGFFVIGLHTDHDLKVVVGNFYNYSLHNFQVNATNTTSTVSNTEIILEKDEITTLPTYDGIYKKDKTLNITIKHDGMTAEQFEVTKKLFSYVKLEMVQDQNVWASNLINK